MNVLALWPQRALPLELLLLLPVLWAFFAKHRQAAFAMVGAATVVFGGGLAWLLTLPEADRLIVSSLGFGTNVWGIAVFWQLRFDLASGLLGLGLIPLVAAMQRRGSIDERGQGLLWFGATIALLAATPVVWALGGICVSWALLRAHMIGWAGFATARVADVLLIGGAVFCSLATNGAFLSDGYLPRLDTPYYVRLYSGADPAALPDSKAGPSRKSSQDLSQLAAGAKAEGRVTMVAPPGRELMVGADPRQLETRSGALGVAPLVNAPLPAGRMSLSVAEPGIDGDADALGAVVAHVRAEQGERVLVLQRNGAIDFLSVAHAIEAPAAKGSLQRTMAGADISAVALAALVVCVALVGYALSTVLGGAVFTGTGGAFVWAPMLGALAWRYGWLWETVGWKVSLGVAGVLLSASALLVTRMWPNARSLVAPAAILGCALFASGFGVLPCAFACGVLALLVLREIQPQ